MKYKVGDKVKIREDLKSGNYYGKVLFTLVMEKFRGKIVTISTAHEDTLSLYLIKEDDENYKWTDEMFEDLAEYTYEDLCEAPVGTKITFENGKIFVKNDKIIFHGDYRAFRENKHLKGLKDNYLDNGQIIKIEEPRYTTVYEAKKDILDEKEKEYLSAVIKPFKDKIMRISKRNDTIINKNVEQICIVFDINSDVCYRMFLPPFKKGTMYKGMETDRKYSLEELGL